MLKNLFKMETSKKLLLLVTIVWLISTIVNYTSIYFGFDTFQIAATYEVISDIFKWEILVYSGKAGVENYQKISDGLNAHIDKMVGKED